MSYNITRECFEPLTPQWQRLLPRCQTDTLFLTPAWQRLWWREMGRRGDLWLLGARNGAGLRGIAPLMCRQDTLSFLGGSDVVDYHDFVVPAEDAPEFFAALLPYLLAAPWREAIFESIPEGASTLEHLPRALEASGVRVEVFQEGVAPGVALPDTLDDYLASLRKKDRHELRRKFRRLEAADTARHYAIADAADLPRAMDDFLRLMRLSRADKSDFMTPEREAFFHALARELHAQGALRLYFLELDGVRVAASFCMDYQGTRLLYNSGYDPAYAHLATSLLLKALCLRDAIEAGMRYFDFLRGDERYKYHLGGKDVPIYTIRARRA